MSETVGVVVASFGNRRVWDVLAQRALGSIDAQTHHPDILVRIHGDTLAKARNEGAEQAGTDWLIMLDCDDELDPHYIEAMLAGDGDVRQPATLGIVDGREDDYPVVIPRKPLWDGNYVVIGAMVRRSLFLSVGGFRHLPCFEDYDLWIRCEQAGAEFVPVPDAIYRVHVNTRGRNHSLAESQRDRVLWQIRRKYYPELWGT